MATIQKSFRDLSMPDLIREVADEVGADAKQVAEAIVERGYLDEEKLRALLVAGVADSVRSYFYRVRSQQAPASPSTRWGAVKTDRDSGALDLARYVIFTGAETKWLGDCDHADLLGAADTHRMVARGHTQAAKQLAKIAALVEESTATIVSELPEDQVRVILDA